MWTTEVVDRGAQKIIVIKHKEITKGSISLFKEGEDEWVKKIEMLFRRLNDE